MFIAKPSAMVRQTPLSFSVKTAWSTYSYLILMSYEMHIPIHVWGDGISSNKVLYTKLMG
jgi:hypothetical protein